VIKKYLPKETVVTETPATTTAQAILPTYQKPEEEVVSGLATTTDLKIEYLAFSDFYVKPDNTIQTKIDNYNLPLNTKIDVLNYHDISRKISLDSALINLNSYGFALVDNPWAPTASDFYSIYKNLSDKQIPLLITSDFMTYYYQNTLKNIFYDNLWDIDKELYEAARTRYEARLASIGNVNDPLLEAARLETAFFAVSLELLKPAKEQIASISVQVDKDKFSTGEARRFSFTVPPYLRDDVAAEVKLIREGKMKTKSPVLLYARDYSDFIVPVDYRSNAKLNNFYLTSRWLNSVFPLYYQEDKCPACLLDQEDWRVNFIAALLISDDFTSLPQLKNRWARIYKVISFFKGLRDDLDYIDYRDSLKAVWGDDYAVEELFKGDNPDFSDNLNKLSAKIASYEFSEIQGGPSKSDVAAKVNVGFKMLASSYSPDNYLFGRLTTPMVGDYLGGKTVASSNITYCQSHAIIKRCNGSYFDILNLVYPITANPYFIENTNYTDYEKEAIRLRRDISASVERHSSNYWSTLSIVKNFLEVDKSSMPLWAQSSEWENKNLKTAAGAWANLQLPLEKFSVNQSFTGQGLSDFSLWSENSYVEPNLNLINELLANNKMITDMLTALQVNAEVKIAVQEIQNSSVNLESLKSIIIKELSGVKLETTDYEAISNFAGQLEIVDTTNSKKMSWALPGASRPLKGDLSSFKLLILISQRDGQKSFSLGPVWNYKESR
jgi:hypothetical protein